ncbi:uncharacterized protein Z520_09617 [Fonsecaea multimorphosa CBS 102226]|uniref:BRCT domain-containing protein n=1 Tax=Fonsecaea multimorphosa CBS 102226 TaxID=1442371 RepID=A0A0D2IBP9_9EURO|nr:uncharacterized protein Z520_09617 [Fonsecaea multimorphosa CBS 102226]KIX94571.1 hypothetical protein Z520_09617 [Fonsecaea multimorphosa CBS 102226]OAL20280.1 hypothetical protein AYO22_08992 [Fonsecaea multimorphosa]
MGTISLVYFTAVGSEILTELPIEGDCSTFYLPDDPVEDALIVTPDMDVRHSNLCLEVHQTFVLLRTFNDSGGPCCVLGDGGVNIELPLSIDSHHKSFILGTDVHFVGPSGRWGLRWGDMDGAGSNSMRPPPLPSVNPCTETRLPTEELLQEPVDVEAVAVNAASQDHSDNSTCSPTPSPQDGRDEDGTRAKEKETFEEVLGESGVPSTPQDVPCTSDQDSIKKLKGVSDNAQATPSIPTVAEHEPKPRKCLSVSVENVAAQGRDLPSTEDIADTPSNFPDAQKPFQGKDDATAASASEKRRGKRKLAEVEAADLSTEIMDAPSTISDDGVSVEVSIVITNSEDKKTQTGTRKKKVAKSSTDQSNPPEPSTATNTTPDSSLSNEQASPKRRLTRQTDFTSPRKYTAAAAPVVIFSGSTSIQEKRPAMRTFGRLGGKVSTEINKATILCIPEGPLKKTGKLVMAVAMGMDIVTEKWISDAHRLGRLPAIEGYLPLDRSRERQWDFNLKDALSRGKTGLTHLLSGTTVFLTKQLRNDLGNLEREISQIATILGADAVKHRLPALKDKGKFSEEKTLIIGIPGDPQGAHIGRLGHTLFNKDILIMAALRGQVERQSADFRIEVPIKDEIEDM